ncbi:hypothetical protein HanIR_Chr15g0765951 [Helianthus annuus]|nr:hypothetical protein HanIR_Chr15g0765951 [Helianthus annuus]
MYPLYCNMIGHTVDKCFEIVGYPPGVKRRINNNQSNKINFTNNNNNNKSNNVVGSSASTGVPGFPFTSEQITKLLSLVGEKSGSNTQNANMGGECFNVSNFVSCSSSVSFSNNFVWIVDSGASQHMVKSDKNTINVVDVSEFNITVSHPNGTSVKVLKIGDLKLTDDILLRDVFFLPDYCVNLLSVYKLAKDNHVSVVFKENSCMLQDSSSKKILVNGSQDSGLYFVGDNGNAVNVCFNSSVKSYT